MRFLVCLTLLSFSSLVSANDCFLDYQSVCGQSDEGISTYLNQCLLKQDGAKQVKWSKCQSEQTRGPATSGSGVFIQAQQIENEIKIFLGENV